MFDLFSVSPQQLQETSTAHVANHLALLSLLVEKGVVTEEEYTAAHVRAVHMVDQLTAARRQEAEEEFDKEHPGVREQFGKIFGNHTQ